MSSGLPVTLLLLVGSSALAAEPAKRVVPTTALDEVCYAPGECDRPTLKQFAIDVRPVTVREYAACVDRGACTKLQTLPPPKSAPNYRPMPADYPATAAKDSPVLWTTHGQAVAYCAARGEHLPTREEWTVSGLVAGASGEWLDGRYTPDSWLAAAPPDPRASGVFGGGADLGLEFEFRCVRSANTSGKAMLTPSGEGPPKGRPEPAKPAPKGEPVAPLPSAR